MTYGEARTQTEHIAECYNYNNDLALGVGALLAKITPAHIMRAGHIPSIQKLLTSGSKTCNITENYNYPVVFDVIKLKRPYQRRLTYHSPMASRQRIRPRVSSRLSGSSKCRFSYRACALSQSRNFSYQVSLAR